MPIAGNLLIYRQGSFAIVKGTDRRSSGTHYTPRSMTEPIVRYTLEPLVYVGPEEGYPQPEWKLKSIGGHPRLERLRHGLWFGRVSCRGLPLPQPTAR